MVSLYCPEVGKSGEIGWPTPGNVRHLSLGWINWSLYKGNCPAHFRPRPAAAAAWNDNFLRIIIPKIWKNLFTFSIESCIVRREQSRRPCVKCLWDGELPGGRRNFSTMGSPHPLLHIGHPPLCSNDTRSGDRSAVNALPFPTGDLCLSLNSLPCKRRGISFFTDH